MTSRLAKIRFIADSINATFRGSNPREQKEIEMIRREFEPYLYDQSPPTQIMDKLGPVAEKLISNIHWDDPSINTDEIVSTYE